MANISWQYCQENSDLILSSGLSLLRNQEGSPFGRSLVDEYGNYLISDQSNNWKYIGETKSLKKRIKQHSGRTSTFYKNYRFSEQLWGEHCE